MLTVARDQGNTNGMVSGIAWTGIMSLLITWTVLFLSRRWETRSEDSIVFRFVQLTAGVLLGLISYSLQRLLDGSLVRNIFRARRKHRQR